MVVIDKPGGLTSHQVVGRVRRILGTRKVGHAGTLDPMATGVLVVGVGAATRLLGPLAGGDKSYTATIRLGRATVTDDAEGEPIATVGAVGTTTADVAAALPALTGAIEQRPSAVSAIKVGGVRSYARVRAGEDVELAARPVTVSRFALLATRRQGELLDCDVEVDCSTGTYVRALARDLGERLGTGGHLTALRRTAVQPLTLTDAVSLEAFADDPALLDLAAVARRRFAVVTVDDDQARAVAYGRSLELALPDEITALLDEAGRFLALYRGDGAQARPVAVFVTP